MVKLVLLLLVLALIKPGFSDLQARSFRCTSTNQTIATDYKCFAKSYSRKVSTINMHFNLTRSIYKANLHLVVQHRTVTPFFTPLIDVKANLCGFLNGTENNVAIKWVTDMISKTIPKDLLHPCPYIGELKAYNCSLQIGPEMSVFLVGRYRTRARVFDDMDDNIFTVLVEMDLTPNPH